MELRVNPAVYTDICHVKYFFFLMVCIHQYLHSMLGALKTCCGYNFKSVNTSRK